MFGRSYGRSTKTRIDAGCDLQHVNFHSDSESSSGWWSGADWGDGIVALLDVANAGLMCAARMAFMRSWPALRLRMRVIQTMRDI